MPTDQILWVDVVLRPLLLAYVPHRNEPLPDWMYSTAGQPCFYIVRAFRSQSPFADEGTAAMVVEAILDLRHQIHCDVDVYCLMPDHLHIVLTPIEDGHSSREFMRRVKGRTAHAVRGEGHGKLWQPGWYDHVLTDRTGDDDAGIAAYILHNPVRRDLCTEPEEYPWSGCPDPLPGGVSEYARETRQSR